MEISALIFRRGSRSTIPVYRAKTKTRNAVNSVDPVGFARARADTFAREPEDGLICFFFLSHSESIVRCRCVRTRLTMNPLHACEESGEDEESHVRRALFLTWISPRYVKITEGRNRIRN